MRELDEGRNPYVEQEFGISDRFTARPRIPAGDKAAAKRRKENRKMIERGQGVNMDDLTKVSDTINVQGRRTRGKGRPIKNLSSF